jgi:hypothetical protein
VGDSQTNRHEAIHALINEEQIVIAVILAVIDLDWTVHRGIDGMLARRGQEYMPDRVSGHSPLKFARIRPERDGTVALSQQKQHLGIK